MKVLVTGAEGFLGRNLSCVLSDRGFQLFRFDINSPKEILLSAVQESDFIFHLAGVNRPKCNEEFDLGNAGFTAELIKIIENTGRAIPLMFSSSIQAELENPYGKSKLKAERIIEAYSIRSGAPCFIYRFPNLFGKWVRPDYNSAVATFCNRIARGLEYSVSDRKNTVKLNYIDDVVEALYSILFLRESSGLHRCTVNPEFTVSLGTIVDYLESFKVDRMEKRVPNVEDPFIKRLYSTYLSYVPIEELAVPANLKHDNRGWLFELVKSTAFGQIFVSITKPGVTRGNHFHHTKVERFCLIRGRGVIVLRRIDDTEVIEIPVNDEDIKIVDIPPGYTHALTNTGDEDIIVLFWANEIFDPERPDTQMLEVRS